MPPKEAADEEDVAGSRSQGNTYNTVEGDLATLSLEVI